MKLSKTGAQCESKGQNPIFSGDYFSKNNFEFDWESFFSKNQFQSRKNLLQSMYEIEKKMEHLLLF